LLDVDDGVIEADKFVSTGVVEEEEVCVVVLPVTT
jgi:hypothetical protein